MWLGNGLNRLGTGLKSKLVIRTLDVAHEGFRELTTILGAAEAVHQVVATVQPLRVLTGVGVGGLLLQGLGRGDVDVVGG